METVSYRRTIVRIRPPLRMVVLFLPPFLSCRQAGMGNRLATASFQWARSSGIDHNWDTP